MVAPVYAITVRYSLVRRRRSLSGDKNASHHTDEGPKITSPFSTASVKSRHDALKPRCPLYPRKRTSEPARVSSSTQQLRQLGDICCDPPGLGYLGKLNQSSD